MRENDAQKKVNDEVINLLTNETQECLLKKTKNARKIYDFFKRLSDDDNQRMTYLHQIKSFTVDSILRLNLDSIKYIVSKIREAFCFSVKSK